MVVLEQFKDPALSRGLLKQVETAAAQAAYRLGRPPVFMELCGTHTTAISRAGLRPLLNDNTELLSGPGCPVCVTGEDELDAMLSIARNPNLTVATFGDMLRVPGANGSSLERERAGGASVFIVSSPLEAVEYAARHPQRQVIFLGVGFETTAPVTSLALIKAAHEGLKNFTVYSAHKLIPPALRLLLAAREVKLDGLILPGHVCAVTGFRAFDFVALEYGLPAVVAGFETPDILAAIMALLKMTIEQTPRVFNGYARLVREDGNPRALELLDSCFELQEMSWRGFGIVEQSGLRLNARFRSFDAADRFDSLLPHPNNEQTEERKGNCRCGELLQGKIKPPQCPLFGQKCRPESPMGPCMVSNEGACASFYRFERRRLG